MRGRESEPAPSWKFQPQRQKKKKKTQKTVGVADSRLASLPLLPVLCPCCTASAATDDDAARFVVRAGSSRESVVVELSHRLQRAQRRAEHRQGSRSTATARGTGTHRGNRANRATEPTEPTEPTERQKQLRTPNSNSKLQTPTPSPSPGPSPSPSRSRSERDDDGAGEREPKVNWQAAGHGGGIAGKESKGNLFLSFPELNSSLF